MVADIGKRKESDIRNIAVRVAKNGISFRVWILLKDDSKYELFHDNGEFTLDRLSKMIQRELSGE